MLVATVAVTPIGLASAAPAFLDPVAIAAGIGVGLASSVIPYVFDQLAMARLSRAAYSLMVSLLPATATVIGLVVLAQVPTPVEAAGVALVVLAMSCGGRARLARWSRYVSATPDSSSRGCARDDELRERRAWPPVDARRGRSRADRPCRGRGRDSFFDTADVYSNGGSEIVTGRLLPKLLSRDELVLATKVHGQMTPGPTGRGLPRKHILSAIDASLERLGMDYVDLYQIHRWDRHAPIEETMDALNDVVRAGKARYIGASSMYAWQFAKAQQVAERQGLTRFVSMQNHYNLLYREEEREMIPQCIDQGVGVLPWSPPRAAGWPGRARARARRTTRAETDPFGDRPTVRRRTSTSSIASPRLPPSAACQRRRSHSRGSCTNQASQRRSSVRRSWPTSRTRSPQSG